MKEILFTGSGVAIVTPFHAGAVNFPAFGRLIDRQIDGGTDAIIVCGTTGEAATMTQKERMETIAYCVDRVAGRVPVIAGTGANDTQVARENALAAERLGVDGLLIVTPYYNKATQQGLLRHYKVIADSVGTPIILYNVPSRTGVNIQPETYAELAQHPNIAGVKEASGNFSQIQKPGTSALPILPSGPAMTMRPPPSVCWAVPGSFPWWPTSSPQKCTG